MNSLEYFGFRNCFGKSLVIEKKPPMLLNIFVADALTNKKFNEES